MNTDKQIAVDATEQHQKQSENKTRCTSSADKVLPRNEMLAALALFEAIEKMQEQKVLLNIGGQRILTMEVNLGQTPFKLLN